MTTTTAPQLALTRIFDAPRALVYREFTDPGRIGRWLPSVKAPTGRRHLPHAV